MKKNKLPLILLAAGVLFIAAAVMIFRYRNKPELEPELEKEKETAPEMKKEPELLNIVK